MRQTHNITRVTGTVNGERNGNGTERERNGLGAVNGLRTDSVPECPCSALAVASPKFAVLSVQCMHPASAFFCRSRACDKQPARAGKGSSKGVHTCVNEVLRSVQQNAFTRSVPVPVPVPAKKCLNGPFL